MKKSKQYFNMLFAFGKFWTNLRLCLIYLQCYRFKEDIRVTIYPLSWLNNRSSFIGNPLESIFHGYPCASMLNLHGALK